VYGVFSSPPPPVPSIMAKRGSKPCGGRRINVEWMGCVGWDGRGRLLFSAGVGGG